MKRDGLLHVGVAFAGGALVASAAFVVGEGPFVFRPELGLGDLLSAAVAIGLGYWVGYLLQRRVDVRKVEKDRLVGQAEEVAKRAASLRTKQERLLKEQTEIPEVMGEARRLSGDLTGLGSKLRIYEVWDELDDQFRAVEKALLEYRVPIGESDLVEDRPSPAEFDRLYRSLTDEIDRLIRDISRLD